MRVFLGMIIGAFLIIMGAYIYDSGNAATERDMVNWDVVSENWQAAKTRAQQTWTHLTART
jgi:hypothetical protein